MAAVPPALVRSYERWMRDCERLRVLGGLSGAGFVGFIGIFRMAGGPPALVRSYERWTRDGERLREIMSVYVCLRVLGGLSEAGFAGFVGIFRMAGGPPALVRSYERWTRDGERLREIMSVCECFRVLGGLSEAGFAGFLGILRMTGGPPALVRSYERWTRVCERLREIMSVCVCLRVLGGLSGAGFVGFFGIFRMAGVPPALVGSYERWTRDGERLREIMSVCECFRVLGGLSGAGFAGFIGIFRMAGGPPALVGSDERWTRDGERLRVFTRDWYGWALWVDHEMGRISCIQTDAGCFEQSTKFSRLVFDGRAFDATGRSRIPAECAACPVGRASDLFFNQRAPLSRLGSYLRRDVASAV